MKTDTEKLEKLIKRMLADESGIARVVSVHVREDTDADDQRILLVDVVFDGKSRDVDVKKLTGIVGKVRPALLQEDETAFPVFSFIAKKEAGHLTRETRRSH